MSIRNKYYLLRPEDKYHLYVYEGKFYSNVFDFQLCLIYVCNQFTIVFVISLHCYQQFLNLLSRPVVTDHTFIDRRFNRNDLGYPPVSQCFYTYTHEHTHIALEKGVSQRWILSLCEWLFLCQWPFRSHSHGRPPCTVGLQPFPGPKILLSTLRCSVSRKVLRRIYNPTLVGIVKVLMFEYLIFGQPQ